MPLITGRRSSVYLSSIRITSPIAVGSTSKSVM